METLGAKLSLYDGLTGPTMSMVGSLSTLEQSFQYVENAAKKADTSNYAMAEVIKLAESAGKQLNEMFGRIQKQIDKNTQEQDKFNKEVKKSGGLVDQLLGNLGKIAGVVGAFVGFQKIVGFYKESIDLANEQIRVEQGLYTVLKNQGKTEEDFLKVRKEANALASQTSISGTAMIAGATELATYTKNAEAASILTRTLGNFAVGMSGKVKLSTTEMVSMATQLGKVMGGAYDGIAKKGFQLTEAQKEVIKKGDDVKKALLIEEIINESWKDLAKDMALTPEGAMEKVKNQFDSIKTKVGMQLLPVVMQLFNEFEQYLPEVESLFLELGPVIYDVAKFVWFLAETVIDGFIWANNAVGGFGMAFLRIKYWAADVWSSVKIGFKGMMIMLEAGWYNLKATIIEVLNTIIKAMNLIPGVNIGQIEMPDKPDTQGQWESLRQDVLKANAEAAENQAKLWEEEKKRETGQNKIVDALQFLNRGMDKVAKNTGDALKLSEDNIAYMKDIAEREAINRFTTAGVTVNMPVNNNVGSEVDLDSTMNYLANGVRDMLGQVAEGASY